MSALRLLTAHACRPPDAESRPSHRPQHLALRTVRKRRIGQNPAERLQRGVTQQAAGEGEHAGYPQPTCVLARYVDDDACDPSSASSIRRTRPIGKPANVRSMPTVTPSESSAIRTRRCDSSNAPRAYNRYTTVPAISSNSSANSSAALNSRFLADGEAAEGCSFIAGCTDLSSSYRSATPLRSAGSSQKYEPGFALPRSSQRARERS